MIEVQPPRVITLRDNTNFGYCAAAHYIVSFDDPDHFKGDRDGCLQIVKITKLALATTGYR